MVIISASLVGCIRSISAVPPETSVYVIFTVPFWFSHSPTSAFNWSNASTPPLFSLFALVPTAAHTASNNTPTQANLLKRITSSKREPLAPRQNHQCLHIAPKLPRIPQVCSPPAAPPRLTPAPASNRRSGPPCSPVQPKPAPFQESLPPAPALSRSCCNANC